jgi:23S rRNA G2445 N2-methylase RlmL
MNKTAIMITTARGLETFLMEEVKAIGLPVIWAGTSAVKSEGSFSDAMRLNLHLRTGHRVLYLLKQCSCRTPDALYAAAEKIPWEDIIPADGYVSVTANVENETIRDTRFAAMRCKDAIVDRMFRCEGRRPDTGPEQKGTVVNLFWRNERCELYLDTSGEPLTKRGYRKNPLGAPMQETLAAGVIMSSGWNGHTAFVNPMCGSGTLAIEAALIAANRAPGLIRQSFGFQHTLLYDSREWDCLRDTAKGLVHRGEARIVASDINTEAVSAAINNAKTAGVERLIEFNVCDFADTVIPEGGGVVIINPEYGLRMGADRELAPLYRGIGNFFKNKCQGYTAYVFTGTPALAGKIGLKSKRRSAFFSGSLECRLYEYEIFGR